MKLRKFQFVISILTACLFGIPGIAATTSTAETEGGSSWTNSLSYYAELEFDIGSGEDDVDFSSFGFVVGQGLFDSANGAGKYSLSHDVGLFIGREAELALEWEQKFKQNLGSSFFAALKNKATYTTPAISGDEALKVAGDDFGLSAALELGLQPIGIFGFKTAFGRTYTKESNWKISPELSARVSDNFSVSTKVNFPVNAPEKKVNGALKLAYSL